MYGIRERKNFPGTVRIHPAPVPLLNFLPKFSPNDVPQLVHAYYLAKIQQGKEIPMMNGENGWGGSGMEICKLHLGLLPTLRYLSLTREANGCHNFSKERYPLYESVGDPTQAVDDGEPPYPRYVWVWELGMWERKQWYVWDRKRRVRGFTRVTKLRGLYWSGSEAPTAAESRPAANRHLRLAKVLPEPTKGTRQSQRVDGNEDCGTTR